MAPEGDSSAVEALADLDDVEAQEELRKTLGEEPEEEPLAPKSRPGFPTVPKHDRATLDVLAVWEFTDEPAVDQWLRYSPQEGRTDAFGRVRFTNLRPGMNGITNGAGSFMNVDLEPGEQRSVTFSIRREYKVRGRVVDEAGAPVAGADVLADGTFGFDSVPEGRHVLVVDASGYAEWRQIVNVKADETLELGRLTMDKGALFRLDLTFDPPLGDDEFVEIYDARIDGGSDEQRPYLGDTSSPDLPLGPVLAGQVQLMLEGAGVYRKLELTVDPERQTYGGEPLQLDGLAQGAEYTLEITDTEGRSGSARLQGGTTSTLELR